MSNSANNDALGTSHKSSAHLVLESQTNYVDHSNDNNVEVYDSLTPHTQQRDNSKDNMNMVFHSQSSSMAAAVSPTDNSITHKQVLKVATHDSAPTHTMLTKSNSKGTLQTHITPNKRLTDYNLNDDKDTKVSSEEVAVQEVIVPTLSKTKDGPGSRQDMSGRSKTMPMICKIPQSKPQKLHGSNNSDPFHSHSLEMFDKLQFLETQPNNDGIEVNKNGNEDRSQMGVDYSKRVTFQGDVNDRIAAVPTTAMPTIAVPTTVSQILTKKYPKEADGLTCPHCAKGFVSQGGLDYHILLACQNKSSPFLVKNKPTKESTRKKIRSKTKGGRIAKITSDYWRHGLQISDTFNGDISAAFDESSSQLNISQKRKPPKGVYETTAGNYQVQVYYQSSLQYIGTFQTLEQATLAHEIAWSMFEKDKGLHLSAKECERNIKLAKEAAWNVKDGKQSGNDTRKKRRSQSRSSSAIFPSSTINYLNECSRLNPYPYADQIARIALVTGLNKMQVEDWMARARIEQRKKANRPSTTLRNRNNTTTIKELEAYMKTWISKNAFSRDWVLTLTPSPSQKDQIILDTGVERKCLEGWLCRVRQKLIKHEKEKPGQGISVLRSAATVITIISSPDTLGEIVDIRPQGLSEKAKTTTLSEKAKTHINKWIEEHSSHPFPTREEKDAWIKLYNIEKDYLLDGYLHRARKKENSTCKQDNDVSSLKTCGLCNTQKKKWSYSRGEWNKLDGRDRQCQVCLSKVKTASLSNDDGPMAVTKTRTGRTVKPRERLVAIPQVRPVKRGRKRPRKIASVRGTTTSSGSTSRTTSRKDMINEIQGVRRLTGCKNRWGAVLKVSGNDIFLGSYKTQTEAAHAVEMAKEESKLKIGMTSGEHSPFIGSESSLADLQDMPSDKIDESLMDTETAKDEELSSRISKYLSPKYQSEKQAEEQHKEQDEDELADNLIAADVMNIPIESVISKFEEAQKAGYQPKTFNLQTYMAEHDKNYTYLVDVKNDDTNTNKKRRKKSTPKRLIGGL